MLERAVHSHIITSHFGYRGNLFYDLVKTSVIRIAFGMARELRKSLIWNRDEAPSGG